MAEPTERWEVVSKEEADSLLEGLRAGTSRVVLMKQDMVTKYAYQVDIVLGILNSPEALITDESTVGDFIDSGECAVDVARLAELSDVFNYKVALSTPLWELARSICWEECGELNGDEESEG